MKRGACRLAADNARQDRACALLLKANARAVPSQHFGQSSKYASFAGIRQEGKMGF